MVNQLTTHNKQQVREREDLCDAYSECCTEGRTGFLRFVRTRSKADTLETHNRDTPRTTPRFPSIRFRHRTLDITLPVSGRVSETEAAKQRKPHYQTQEDKE